MLQSRHATWDGQSETNKPQTTSLYNEDVLCHTTEIPPQGFDYVNSVALIQVRHDLATNRWQVANH